MKGVRRNTAKNDIVFEAMLPDFKRLARPEAVTNENPWFLIRLCFVLGIIYKFHPVQAVYPDGEHAKRHRGVGYAVRTLQWVVAGQIIR